MGQLTGRRGRDPQDPDLYGRGWEEGRKSVLSDLVDQGTIAERAGVSRPAINHWRDGKGTVASHPFPAAVLQFGPTRLWLWSEVEPWLRRYGQLKQEGHSTVVERSRAGAEPIAKPRERSPGRSVPKVRSKSAMAISSDVARVSAVSLRKAWVRVCKRALCSRPPLAYSDWCAEHEPEVGDAAWTG